MPAAALPRAVMLSLYALYIIWPAPVLYHVASRFCAPHAGLHQATPES
ncbi:MAG: hypothetical protein ACE5JJ_09905 [Nitrospinota bacterium]